MPHNWKNLGDALRHSRLNKNMTQLQVADELGVSRSTVQSIERGTSGQRVTPTIRAYSELVGSTVEDVYAVLRGPKILLSPRPAESSRLDDVAGPEEASNDDVLPVRIADELCRGRLVDTDVIPIGPVDAEAQVVIVVRAGATLTSETRQQVVGAWRTAQTTLRNALSSSSEPGL